MSKKSITKKSISNLISVCFALLALVILFSPNTPFGFLAEGISFVIGFIGFWMLLPFIFLVSVYILLKKKFLKLKFKRLFWSIFILIISILIFTSIRVDLKINNFAENYVNLFSKTRNSLPSYKLCGGFIGFFFASAFNSLITPVGSYIFCSLLFIFGVFLMFFKVIKKKIIEAREDRKAAKEKKEKEQNEEVQEETEVVEENKDENIEESETESSNEDNNAFAFESSPKQTKLKRAHFVLDKKEKVVEPINSNVLKEPEPKEASVGEITSEEVVNDNSSEIIEENNFVSEQPVELNKPIFEDLNKTETSINEENQTEVIAQDVDPLHRPQPKAISSRDYVLPTTDLLKYHEQPGDSEKNESSCQERTDNINKTFADFRIGATVVGHTVGPAVTRFDVQMDAGVSVNSITKNVDDISVNLRGLPVRFEPIVYGKSTAGLEIPNQIRVNVGLREAIEGLSNEPKHLRDIPFGKNISGEMLSANLTEFPHMLVSGTTGSGKTIFIHSILLTLIMRNKPEDLKVVLVDPKKVELSFYEEIPHLLCPNISDPRKAFVLMKKLVDEMERRYNLFASSKVRDIKGFNTWAKSNNIQHLPYIVVFIDEFADLVDSCREIKEPISKLAAKARAAGIHFVFATQRPSVNVIDGVIKGNISTRVALLSASATDSVTIIGEGGAEKLLGNGDMLIECPLLSTSGKPRVQGCFVEIDEINAVCDFLRKNNKVQYDPYFLDLEEKQPEIVASAEVTPIDKTQSEELQYQSIKEQICCNPYCSISYIQRTFGMGFPRAGRIFARLVKEGIVASTGDAHGNKVLVQKPSEQQMGTIEQSTYIPDSLEDNND